MEIEMIKVLLEPFKRVRIIVKDRPEAVIEFTDDGTQDYKTITEAIVKAAGCLWLAPEDDSDLEDS